MSAVLIDASDFVRDTRSVVDSAKDVAAHAVRHLRAGASVVVSVRGVRGVSSSFFNVLLQAVETELGPSLGGLRFIVETENATQRMIYERSRSAVISRRRSG